jgi:hypothetical protein
VWGVVNAVNMLQAAGFLSRVYTGSRTINHILRKPVIFRYNYLLFGFRRSEMKKNISQNPNPALKDLEILERTPPNIACTRTAGFTPPNFLYKRREDKKSGNSPSDGRTIFFGEDNTCADT